MYIRVVVTVPGIICK